jgi:hypothetical protein
VFVRFIFVDDGEHHRSAQGFRKGWLMFFGVHPNYRSDVEIANAVSTFGKYTFGTVMILSKPESWCMHLLFHQPESQGMLCLESFHLWEP